MCSHRIWIGFALSISVASVVGAQVDDPHTAMPERPGVATHAHTVAPGWVETEMGFEQPHANDRFGDPTLPLALKLGLTRHTQLTVGTAVTHPADGQTTPVDDVSVGIKWRILEGAPVAGDIAVLPSATVPTEPDGLATAGLLLIASRTVGPLSLDLNAGYTRREGDGTSAPRQEYLWAAALGGPFHGRFGWFGELSGSPPTSGPGGRDRTVNSLVGASVNVRAWLVFDIAVSVPLTGPDASALMFGAVWNIGPIWTSRPSTP